MEGVDPDRTSSGDPPTPSRRWLAGAREWANAFGHRWGRETLPLLGLLAVALPLAAWWTWFDGVRLATFHLSAYDLGVNYQAIWAAAHGSRIDASGPLGYVFVVYPYVPFYYLFPSGHAFLEFLVYFEVGWLFLGALPLYLVARDRLRSRTAATLLAIAYLVYPAFNGPLWFPIHMEALFPTLFLFGYWRYRAGDYRLAAAFFLVALFTNIGAPIVLALFGLGIVLEPGLAHLGPWVRHMWEGEYRVPRLGVWFRGLTRREGFGAFLIAAAGIEFGAILVWYGAWSILYFIGHASFASGAGFSRAFPIDPFSNGSEKLGTLIALFVPLLGLPLLGREERWALVPLLGAGILTPERFQFLFPFKDQYSVWLFPFLFAATVRGLERLEARRHRLTESASRARSPIGRFRRWRHRRTAPEYSAMTLVAVVAFASFLAPWSPGNLLTAKIPGLYSAYYPVASEVTGNQTVDAHLRALESLVPASSILLLQNNLPGTMDRNGFYIPGYYNTSDPLDALINDPYNIQFYPGQNFGPVDEPMIYWSNYFLNQSNWGVVGEADGALLLAHGYAGPPKLYDPLFERFTLSQFPGFGGTVRAANASTGMIPLVGGPALPIDEEYTVYSPGSFQFVVSLSVDHPTSIDQLVVELSGAGGTEPLWQRAYSGANWSGTNGTVSISFPVSFYQYYAGMHFVILLKYWDSPISFHSLTIRQTAPAVTGAL